MVHQIAFSPNSVAVLAVMCRQLLSNNWHQIWVSHKHQSPAFYCPMTRYGQHFHNKYNHFAHNSSLIKSISLFFIVHVFIFVGELVHGCHLSWFIIAIEWTRNYQGLRECVLRMVDSIVASAPNQCAETNLRRPKFVCSENNRPSA